MRHPTPGIYETLLTEELSDVLRRHPELRSVFGKLDPEEEPSRYAAVLAGILEKVLRDEVDSTSRLRLCNELIDRMSVAAASAHLSGHRLVLREEPVLQEITPKYLGAGHLPRPETAMVESSLFTGSPLDPPLFQELVREMGSADSVDILISFIKWSGLRLLMPAFDEAVGRGVPVRVLTTSYMGASDAKAVEWLARQRHVQVRVSYDTTRTRLHAKAYHFRRASGYSTAYIGSANMSDAAMTSGLEWNLKVTAQDMPHILDKFLAEFETYWNSAEFQPVDPENPEPFRAAIQRVRLQGQRATVQFDIRPHPFQERILEALKLERELHGRWRNLVVAATGTGKTVIAAFDFRRFFEERGRRARMLFVAHRREILEQAIQTFQMVLRIPDFGRLQVGSWEADRYDHLFCSVDMLGTRRLWDRLGAEFYDYIVVDEVHHGPAEGYRGVFEKFLPKVLLGLTATPERMDGKSVAADFGNRFAAEIRLPEALEERLLCPFQYFGVNDPVSLDADRFWKGGRYDVGELERVYTGAHALAQQRMEVVLSSLLRWEPDLGRVRGIGFCVSVKHAEYMAQGFSERGVESEVLVGETPVEDRGRILEAFRGGRLRFLFTRDVLNEGLDVPEVNTVLFLRPTESLTVFLQQLGRGLRHAPGKDCLTVLDFVGRLHRRYRMDRKWRALLTRQRFSLEREVEMDFPHLPAGCSIQLDRVARERVLEHIRCNLRDLERQVPDRLESFERESGLPLSFGNFVRFHGYEAEELLSRATWSQWKAKARLGEVPKDPDLDEMGRSLLRAAQTNGPREIRRMQRVVGCLRSGDIESGLAVAGEQAVSTHYRLWGKPGRKLGMATMEDSYRRAARNPSVLSDLEDVLAWSEEETRVAGEVVPLPFACGLELHAAYGSDDIKAAIGEATLETAGQTGVGFLEFRPHRVFAALVTFQKTERDFSPSTMYQDYPISRELLHWETQSQTSVGSERGQNLIHHRDRGYTLLFFVRSRKKVGRATEPFTYLGPASLVRHESERPIRMVWRLDRPMPVEMFEENRRGG